MAYTRKAKDKAAIISEASALLYKDGDKLGSDEEKITALSQYIAAKYLMAFRTAREYAKTVVMRHKLNLSDMKLTDLEIMAKGEKVAAQDVRETLKERLAREDGELRAGWGNVREVSEEGE